MGGGGLAGEAGFSVRNCEVEDGFFEMGETAFWRLETVLKHHVKKSVHILSLLQRQF